MFGALATKKQKASDLHLVLTDFPPPVPTLFHHPAFLPSMYISKTRHCLAAATVIGGDGNIPSPLCGISNREGVPLKFATPWQQHEQQKGRGAIPPRLARFLAQQAFLQRVTTPWRQLQEGGRKRTGSK